MYFSLPSNLAFHDLTCDKRLPNIAKSVLGLNLKFIPTPKQTTSDLSDNFTRFVRDFHLKVYFGCENTTAEDIRINQDMLPKLYIKSDWEVPDFYIPRAVDRRIYNFKKALTLLFTERPGKPNLLPYQRRVLQNIRRDDNIIIANADKGLGPCSVTYEQYVNDALVHLKDATTYAQLTEAEATTAAANTCSMISEWCTKHRNKGVTVNDVKYIRKALSKNKDPFGYFYVMYKIHKPGRTTRPVCSDCSSIIHALGKWITTVLLPIAQRQQSYFENSFALKTILDEMEIPPNTKIFSCDAVSMYTNIPTGPALEVVGKYLHDNVNPKLATAIIEALKIVMENNIICFGDTYWRQISGTAMGISPAPPWAILFFAIHENVFTIKWQDQLPFWKRFIDDGLGLWKLHADPIINNNLWNEFKQDVNTYHGLQWKFTPLSNSVDFMDMTITIANNKFDITLFEKPLSLYLYIPPASVHPPGMIVGLVHGMVLRMYKLCSKLSDIQRRMKTFYRRLLRRGYSAETLIPLFCKANENALQHLRRTPEQLKQIEDRKLVQGYRRVFFHLQYHPNDPNSRVIQKVWKETILQPPGEIHINQIKNHEGERIPIDQLTIAYSRPPNFGNMFSVRKFNKKRGPNVSSFL